ncbi:thiol-activated cytolysin family protein [Pricia sp. S334]|uniref:Thiol-activated cytolysin family protein n=1 Tax=Pricia mediterranea TaxID=3076079 RepID=A0ABU3L909_9FLAO|nr:thiol-activated cytolysin family protein [Pricia sp. S334]MDT7829557.1 thiol-activated cytolysin family protein [Pricia sp. S334]
MKTFDFKMLWRTCMFAIVLLVTFSCQKDDISDPTQSITGGEADEFNVLMANRPSFTQPEEVSEPVEVEEKAIPPAQDEQDSSLECYTNYYKAAPGFDEMLALDPTTDVIFPGAILKGETIPTGEYVPIVADRAPITLSASLTNISGSPVVQITDPKLSTVREGIKTQILDQEVTGATAAKVNFSISEVYSEEHLKLAIGVNYRSAVQKVSGSFDFSKSTYQHKFVLKYFQVYYTIDMDPPKNPSDLFTSVPDINSLGSTSPVYVATVTYGRMVIYTIESNYSITEIDTAFKAALDPGNEGSVDTEYENVISESKVEALVIGGSGSDAAQTVNGPADVYQYISNGGDYSKDSPGAPLSYKLRYLKQGTPVARVVLSSEYPVRQCDLAFPVFSIELDYLECTGCQDGDGSEAELFGRLTATLFSNGTQKGGKVAWDYKEGATFQLKKNEKRFVNLTVPPIELYRPDYNADHVAIGGRLEEDDVWPDANDDFGSTPDKILLKNIPFEGNTFIVDFGEVKVGYYLKRLK